MTTFTNVGEERVLKWLRDPSTAGIDPVLPWKVRLVKVLGTDAAVGTPVTGAQATPQNCVFAAPFEDTDGDFVMENNAILRYEELDAQDVVGGEIIDSAGTPIRWAHGALVSTVTVVQGAPFEFAIGDVRWKLR